MKKRTKILLGIILLLAITIAVVFLVVLPGVLNNAAKLQAYDFGANDQIPTLNAAVGERKVTGVSTSSGTGGAQQKSYTYETETLNEDLNKYVGELQSKGFNISKAMDGNEIKGSMQLAGASADEGKIILIDLAWDNTKIAVQLTKGEGTITPN